MNGFVKISKYAGMREDIVQAGGGNSSYKINDEKMLIKASGYQLADISESGGYAVVNPEIIKKEFLGYKNIDLLTDKESRDILAKSFIEGERPSIETFLHSISGSYTLHTHPICVNILACRKNGMKILKELFPEALIVSYATPGVNLAKEYFKAYKNIAEGKNKLFETVFLQNHGLVISGESAEKVIEKTEEILLKLEQYLGLDYGAYHTLTDIWKLIEDKIVWKITDENILKTYRKDKKMWKHAFCPDCVVFLGKKILELPDRFTKEDIEEFRQLNGDLVMISHRENLYIAANSVKNAMEIQSVMSFSAQVMDMNKNQECCILPEEEQNFLLNWDAEKYRKVMK